MSSLAEWDTNDSPLFSEYLKLMGKQVQSTKVAPIGPGDALLVIDMQVQEPAKDSCVQHAW
jgi:hypothetical protein